MAKRVVLFLVTNLAIVLTLSIILSLLGVGRYVGPNGINLGSLAIFCFVWGMGGAFISLAISRWTAKRMTGVQLVNGRSGDPTADWLYATVAQLTQKANLPMPEVGIYPSEEVNAFATGPSKNKSLVAVSSGLLRSMRREEVEGVLAHEVAHIANGDMVTMTLLQGIVNAFVMFLARIIAYALTSRGSRDDRGAAPSYMLVWVLELVLGVIGMIVVAWFSRQREFRADHGGATLAGKADMLAALRRLGANRGLIDPSHESLATMKISGKWTGLFSTHPPLEQRIAVLERAQIS
ncbi:MAG TPA: protease HtpX [Vicinamibacterales bacterium]|nr:protease HtpX [Vicinamibacterales bacterium]